MSHLDPHHLARQFGVSTEQAVVLSGPAKIIELAHLAQP